MISRRGLTIGIGAALGIGMLAAVASAKSKPAPSGGGGGSGGTSADNTDYSGPQPTGKHYSHASAHPAYQEWLAATIACNQDPVTYSDACMQAKQLATIMVQDGVPPGEVGL